MVPALFNKEAN